MAPWLLAMEELLQCKTDSSVAGGSKQKTKKAKATQSFKSHNFIYIQSFKLTICFNLKSKTISLTYLY